MGFSTLPHKASYNIYERMLIVAHPIYIFQDIGSRVEMFAPETPHRWLALLHINRQINHEASAVLYGRNKFALMNTTRHQVGLLHDFMKCIGPVNTSFLSHLCVDFPVIEGQPPELDFREDDLQSLNLIQENCTNLRTLEMHIHNYNSSSISKMDQDSSEPYRGALSRLDVQLKAIPPLAKVILRVGGGTPSPSVIAFMQGLGWTVLPGNRDQW